MTVAELITAVGEALGTAAASTCAEADVDGDGSVRIDEIVIAVSTVLTGCPVPVFVDVTRSAGVDYRQQVENTPPTSEAQQMSGGAAAADFDGDGWIDLVLTRYDAPLVLLRNRGDGTFEDVTERAGLDRAAQHSNGAAWGDIDNDGDQDLYVTLLGPAETGHRLFVNDGSGAFSEEGGPRGADLHGMDPHYGFSAAFGDYDRDGWIDLHVTEWRPDGANSDRAPSNTRLLHNLGRAAPGHFVDVTTSAGVGMDGLPTWTPRVTGGLAFTSRFSDLDDDGWPDLIVASDFGTSRLFWNRGDGTFLDGTASAGVGAEENGMGIAVGDYDGDGRLDLFVSSVFDPSCSGCSWGTSGNRLYRNEGGRTFSDQTDSVGVRNGSWGWAASFLDVDNDGDLDLGLVNGVPFAEPFRHDPTRLWRNNGGKYVDIAAQVGLVDTRLGKGLVVFDYDRDGDLDLLVANRAEGPTLFRNDAARTGNWLRIKLVGTRSSRDALGARVTLVRHPDARPQVREVAVGCNHLSQNEPVLHFGVGASKARIARVEIRWPIDGRTEVLEDLPVNRLLTVTEADHQDKLEYLTVNRCPGLTPFCVQP